MELAALYLAGRDWLWPATAVGAAGLLLVAWTYSRTPASRGLRLTCAALKIVGLGALIACLLEPMWTGERARPGANLMAVVADNSLSMKLKGRGESQTRGDALVATLSGESNVWRTQLALDFTVRNYLADARLQPTQDFRELAFDGRASALGTAMRNLADRYRSQPLAGVILLTDGVAPDIAGLDTTGLPPIHSVVFGSDHPPRDLAISGTSVSQTAFEDAPVTIQADIAAVGCAGESVVGKLFTIDPANPGADTKPIAIESATIPKEGDKTVLRFQVRPEKAGVIFYKLVLAAKQHSDDEATFANNETIVTVDRGSVKQRILYVSGRPNWEYKFLSRALAEDDQVHLVGLIRVAKREPKFEFKGRSGESSNPLFRGFGNQAKDEIERYDQPVLIPLNVDDEFELRDGFPKTPEDLYRYRAVIIDDLEAEFFTPDQMTLVQRFVSERGGGLLMLGGAESFSDGKFIRTPIGEMLPTYLRAQDAKPMNPEAQYRWNFTKEGLLQPWSRLRMNEAEERERLQDLPHFDVLNRVGDPKPAATVVATVSDGLQNHPALVTQRFGRGRTAALLVGDLWHAGLGDEARQKDLGKFWRQTIRWLVADVPESLEVRAEPQTDGQGVRVQVRARDEKFEPTENASVAIKVRHHGGGDPLTLTAEPSAEEPGLYEAIYLPRESGGYRVEAAVTKEDGGVAGNAITGWSTDLAAEEFRSLLPNRALLESLAQKTGGSVLTPGELNSFVHDLPARRAPVTEMWSRPLWHTPWVFLFALACFVTEWGLRRWKGLA
jgi:uncharacterized membrane protein